MLILTPDVGDKIADVRRLAETGPSLIVLPKWRAVPDLRNPDWVARGPTIEAERLEKGLVAKLTGGGQRVTAQRHHPFEVGRELQRRRQTRLQPYLERRVGAVQVIERPLKERRQLRIDVAERELRAVGEGGARLQLGCAQLAREAGSFFTRLASGAHVDSFQERLTSAQLQIDALVRGVGQRVHHLERAPVEVGRLICGKSP